MSILTETTTQLGTLERIQTNIVNGAKLIDFAAGADGDVLTWDESKTGWRPMAPTVGTNVYVKEENSPGTFYMTFVPELDDSVPLNTNVNVTYNPGSQVLTVPYVDGLASEAVNSLNAMNVEVTNDTTTNATLYPTFVSGTTGYRAVKVDNTGLTFNPSTNTLTVANLNGNASSATTSGSSSSVTVTNNTATNAPFFLTFVAGNSGAQAVQVDSQFLQFNPFLNTLTVPNVQGNASSATDATNAANVGVTNDVATAATMYPTFVLANSGNNNVRVDSTNLTYDPSTNVFSSGLFSGSLINVVTINGAPYPPPLPSAIPTGNTLTVDDVYGDDGLAAANRYAVSFKTISAALALAVSGENVRVNAGTYNESLTIPNGVSLTGAGAQCVVIQKLLVTASTTLITMGLNCRVENFTANLSSAGDHNLTGVNFPSGTSVNAKLRNSIWTVTSTYVGAGNPSIIGVLSAGTSSTAYTAANAIQRSTINVLSSSNGTTRGIYVSGDNFFAVRDIVVYARGSSAGTGSNIVGVETTNANAYCEIKTSTVSGVLYDINRSAGNLLLGFTDLRNNKANGNSFSVVTESSTTTFGIIGDLKNNHTSYLVPGTMTEPNLPATAFNIPIVQNMILFAGTVRYTGSIGSGVTVTLYVYKNGALPPNHSFTIQLTTGQNTKSNQLQSVDFTQGDTYYATCVTVGNPGSGTFTATLAFY